MSFTDILAELPRLAQHERREIADRALALDDDAQIIEERRHLADEAFRMLDALEDEDFKNTARRGLDGGPGLGRQGSTLSGDERLSC